MVGASILRKVVGSDPLRSVARPDEGSSEGIALLLGFSNLHVEESRLEEPHRFGAILMLASLVLAKDD